MSKFAKKSAIVASIVASFTGLATAQPEAPSLTRAAVVAELQAARASGYMAAMHGEDSGASWLNHRRTAVQGAPSASRPVSDNALAAALIGEDSGSFYLSAQSHQSTQTRANVMAGVASGR